MLACFFISHISLLAYDLPIRVIAKADVLHLQYHRYVVVEFLEVHNDDYSKTLLVNAITADSWIGHQVYEINENWLDGRRIIEVPPGTVMRIAERKRIVSGYAKRDWWIRWIRFNVITNRGFFISNWVSSPFKRPGNVDSYLFQKYIDPIAEPGDLTPMQKIIRNQ